MKKILAIAVVALGLISCKNSVESDILSAFEDATEKMEQIKNADEGKEINDELCKTLQQIVFENKEDVLKLANEGSKDIDEVFKKYMDVREEKCGEAHMFMIIPSLDTVEDYDSLLNSYEEYVDQFISYQEKANNGDTDALTEYQTLMEKAKELSEKLEKAKGDMSSSQAQRYLDITTKMTNAAAN